MPNLLRFAALLAATGPLAYADAVSELAAFSAFKDVKVEALANGQVKSSRGAAMSFPRGLAIESCYVVKKPLTKTSELHVQWTPSRHPELKVFLHGDVSKSGAGDFDKLAGAPSNPSVKAFAAATRKLPADRAGLQLSNAEAKAFAGDSSSGGMSPAVAGFWSKVLQGRAQTFLSGGLGKLPPYDMGGESIHVSEEVSRLLKEAPKVRTQFAGLIDATAIGGGKGTPASYWELNDVEGQGAVSLGAIYHRSSGATWQSAEIHYYASGGYYVLLTLQQMWPVTVSGQEATLVWRGDLISAASLAARKGVERMGSSTAMMRETQKSVNAMLSDIAKAP